MVIDADTSAKYGFNPGDSIRAAGTGQIRSFKVVGVSRFGNVNSLGGALQRGGSASRCAAARDLGRFGAPAVDHLVYALANDKDWCVREAAIQSLGQIGPAARAAVPQLQAIIRANPYECTVCERKQMEDQAHFEDLRRAARAALQRITGG